MRDCTRREFLRSIGLGAAGAGAGALAFPRAALAAPGRGDMPNVILCMTDDQGWGDTGYNGHKVLKTPNLDAMSRDGIRFDSWHAGAPVCSPTRGSCITGRHPYRYGIFTANVGHMRKEEITLADALKTQGYVTGHFGKWHLGTLTTKIKDANRGGPGSEKHYSPPWENGFDVCFSTESKVPTWDPMKMPSAGCGYKSGGRGKGPGEHYGTHYFDERGEIVTDNLEGDDSRVIMDRAVPFIRKAVAAKKPFLALVWFHTPHLPAIAGSDYLRKYEGRSESERHYYGCITAMDEQVGRLRTTLRELGVERDTMLWFSSDNGPENGTPGSSGPFRARKRSLYEGGTRVPGMLVWPEKIEKPRVVTMPCSTSDYFPTVMDVLGFRMKGQPLPIDGESLLPVINGKTAERPRPIGFESSGQVSLTDNRYKIYKKGGRRKRGKKKGGGAEGAKPGAPAYELYDLIEDPGEKDDLAREKSEVVEEMRAILEEWRASCKRSLAGEDYR